MIKLFASDNLVGTISIKFILQTINIYKLLLTFKSFLIDYLITLDKNNSITQTYKFSLMPVESCVLVQV